MCVCGGGGGGGHRKIYWGLGWNAYRLSRARRHNFDVIGTEFITTKYSCRIHYCVFYLTDRKTTQLGERSSLKKKKKKKGGGGRKKKKMMEADCSATVPITEIPNISEESCSSSFENALSVHHCIAVHTHKRAFIHPTPETSWETRTQRLHFCFMLPPPPPFARPPPPVETQWLNGLKRTNNTMPLYSLNSHDALFEFSAALRPHRPLGTGSQRRPPRLSHSSWALTTPGCACNRGPFNLHRVRAPTFCT